MTAAVFRLIAELADARAERDTALAERDKYYQALIPAAVAKLNGELAVERADKAESERDEWKAELTASEKWRHDTALERDYFRTAANEFRERAEALEAAVVTARRDALAESGIALLPHIEAAVAKARRDALLEAADEIDAAELGPFNQQAQWAANRLRARASTQTGPARRSGEQTAAIPCHEMRD